MRAENGATSTGRGMGGFLWPMVRRHLDELILRGVTLAFDGGEEHPIRIPLEGELALL